MEKHILDRAQCRDVATGSRGEASGHLCTALMCCTSCVQETGNYEINGVAVTDPVLCSSLASKSLLFLAKPCHWFSGKGR